MLLGLSVVFRKNRIYFLGAVIATIIAAVAALAALVAPVWTTISESFGGFFGQSALLYPISEMEPLDLATAWASFNWGLILLVAGLAALVVLWMKKRHPWHFFALTWAAVILFSAILHARYEYYLAVIVALVSAIGVVYIIGWSREKEPEGARTKENAKHVPGVEKIRRRGGYHPAGPLCGLFPLFGLHRPVRVPDDDHHR